LSPACRALKSRSGFIERAEMLEVLDDDGERDVEVRVLPEYVVGKESPRGGMPLEQPRVEARRQRVPVLDLPIAVLHADDSGWCHLRPVHILPVAQCDRLELQDLTDPYQ
jgi:hypothetical protein